VLRAGDGVLRFPAQSVELGRVLVYRGDRFLVERPGVADALTRVLTLNLATVREDGDPTGPSAPSSRVRSGGSSPSFPAIPTVFLSRQARPTPR
jgi:hypothetical protein